MGKGNVTRISKLFAFASLVVGCAVPLVGFSGAGAASLSAPVTPSPVKQCSVNEVPVTNETTVLSSRVERRLTGVSPVDASISVAPGQVVTIRCAMSGANDGITVAEASPINGSYFLSSGIIDATSWVVLPTDTNGNADGTFTIPRNFVGADPTASCPPSQYQRAMGSGECALVLWSSEQLPALTYTYIGTITVEYAAQPPTAWTAIAAPPDGAGYWLVNGAGVVHPHGAVTDYGDLANVPLNAPVAGIASTADGKGYWLVAQDGGVFAFGDARFMGSMGGSRLDAPVAGMAVTADGKGYWLVAGDGGVFSFGDARFEGSLGGRPILNPVVAMAADPAGGYWLINSAGAVTAYPGADDIGCPAPTAPVVRGLVAAANQGFWHFGTDGSVIACDGASSFGSMKGQALAAPVIGATLDRATGGYWLLGADGGVFSFHAPFYGAG